MLKGMNAMKRKGKIEERTSKGVIYSYSFILLLYWIVLYPMSNSNKNNNKAKYVMGEVKSNKQ